MEFVPGPDVIEFAGVHQSGTLSVSKLVTSTTGASSTGSATFSMTTSSGTSCSSMTSSWAGSGGTTCKIIKVKVEW